MRKKSTKKGKKFFLLCENFDKYRKNGQKTCKIAFVMIVFICFAIEGDGKVSATLYVDFSEVLMKIKAKRRPNELLNLPNETGAQKRHCTASIILKQNF